MTATELLTRHLPTEQPVGAGEYQVLNFDGIVEGTLYTWRIALKTARALMEEGEDPEIRFIDEEGKLRQIFPAH